ncbi:MAG: DNA polymerase III subunit alpha, partial [Gallionellaceae bacterium]|jgi:DNA polymerase-3 subunit alpha|nr:DNA polymerase III subunit alpha [Gallionellaceae bacterium]
LFDFCRRVDKRIVNRRAIEALIRGGAFDKLSDHRYQLLASLDAALGSAEQFARSANQNSLFGDDESVAMPVLLADVLLWGERERLQNEKLALGFYLSGHPYQEYATELAHFVKHRLVDLTPQLVSQRTGNGERRDGWRGEGGGRRGGMSLILAGMVSGVRIQQTRRGRMAVVTLDDGSAQVEMTVFNELFENSRPWIREDELLVVRGKASMDEYSGNMRVSADELFDFASARSQFARHLEIAVDANQQIRIEKLKELFAPYREEGRCPVVIHYRNGTASTQMRLGDDWRITLHDGLMSDLGKLLGERNVRVSYAA